jgi:hypothetical protein
MAAALACLAVACGRSELDDQRPEGGDGEAGSGADASAPLDAGVGADGAGPTEDGASGTADALAPDAAHDAPVPANESGTPESGAAGCNATTCSDSCCLPDGTCAPVENEQACGSGGNACEACGPGEFCKGGCVRYQDDCNASNCPGCCENVNLCAAGNSNYACGHAGLECQRCVPSEGTGLCVLEGDAGGSCVALTTCDPSNCQGCCVGSACVVGDADGACGSRGVACTACSGSQTCTFDTTGQYGAKGQNVCAVTSPCDPSTCGGCCDGLVCAEGTQDIACGAGGVPCVDCQSAGRACVMGACK